MYRIKEIFTSLQGEGVNTGRVAVFVRFSGCNLWSGFPQDRSWSVCKFCDTDFLGTDGENGGEYESPLALVETVIDQWPKAFVRQVRHDRLEGSANENDGDEPPEMIPDFSYRRIVDHGLVICTGGEPLLQLDAKLIEAFHHAGFSVAVETNGTVPAPEEIDWLTVSPKAGAELKQQTGNELKLVLPQKGLDPAAFEKLHFDQFCLQPLDDANREEHTKTCIDYCREHPRWRLSLQTHKLIGVR